MAEDTREGAERRAEGRERRKSMLTEPFEKLSDAAGGDDDSSGSVDVRGTVKRAVLSAAVAAAVGAAAGAAKTMLDRRGENQSDEPEAREASAEDEQDDEPQARAEPAEEEDEPEARAEPAEQDDEDEEPEGRAEPAEEDDDEDEPEARAEPADDDDREPEANAQAEDDEDDEEDEQQQGRAEHDDDDEEDDTQARLEDAKKADTDAADIVPQAREQFELLLGRAAESVSGFEREDGHWKVNLEVVELRRIPDSSDVLASYELVLDDEGRVARMTRVRRYQRAEVESG